MRVKAISTGIRLFLALLLAAGLGLVSSQPVRAAVVVEVYVDADNTTAGVQSSLMIEPTTDNFTVSVYIDQDSNAQGLNGGSIFLTYNPAKLQIDSFATGSDNPLTTVLGTDTANNTAGMLIFSRGKLVGAYPTANFTMVTVLFRPQAGFLAVRGATTDIDFSTNVSANTNTDVRAGAGSVLLPGGLHKATITINPGVQLTIMGTNNVTPLVSTIVAGTSFDVTVIAKEQGVTKTNYLGTVNFTSTDPLAVLPAGYIFQAGDLGQKTFTGLILKTAGVRTVTATDNATSSITGTANITVTNAPINHLAVTGTATMTAGGSNALTIRAYDQYDNIVTSYNGTKSLTFSGPGTSDYGNAPTVTDNTGAAVAVGTATVITFTSGNSTAGGSLVAYKAESTTIDVTDGTYASTANASWDIDLTVNPTTANHLKVTGTATMTAGSSNALTIRAYDQYGNIATGYTGDKNLTFSGPVASPYGNTPTVTAGNTTAVAIGSTTNITFTSGNSTAGGSLVAYTAESTTVDVTDGTINSTANATWDLDLTVSPATASHLKVTGTATITAGSNNELTVTAYDQYGNTATGYNGTKSLTFSGPGTSPNSNIPTVEGTAIGTAASFTFASGATAANAATLVAYLTEVTTVDVSNSTINSTTNASWDLDLTVNPATASVLKVTGITDPIVKGVSSNVTVKAEDTYGNKATSYTGAIYFTSSDSLATLAATLAAPYTFTSSDNGTHTFAAGVTMGTYGEQSVTAKDTVTATITGSQTGITVIPVITANITLGVGWNLFSTPIPLESGYRTWAEVKAVSDNLSGLHPTSPAYYYDPSYTVGGVSLPWRVVTDSYQITPSDAIYVKMVSSDNVAIIANSSPAVPSKSLYAGWNLVGLGFLSDNYTSANATSSAMRVDYALTSVFTVTGVSSTGYAQVVSPALNQPGWYYLRGNPGAGTIPDMLSAKGYWVYMVNPGTLVGFTTTPLP